MTKKEIEEGDDIKKVIAEAVAENLLESGITSDFVHIPSKFGLGRVDLVAEVGSEGSTRVKKRELAEVLIHFADENGKNHTLAVDAVKLFKAISMMQIQDLAAHARESADILEKIADGMKEGDTESNDGFKPTTKTSKTLH